MQITARKFTSLLCLLSRNEYFEVSNMVLNNHWCSSSAAAAVSSDSFAPRQCRKRVTKKERIAMVLDFVEKHRALNGGKFPSACCTQKQIGGSYYVTRAIIQELEYNYKRAFLETKREVKLREENAKCEVFFLTEQSCISNGADTVIRENDSGNRSKTITKTSRLSIKNHPDNQFEVNAYKQLTPRYNKESQEYGCLDFDNLHASPSTRADTKPQVHTSAMSDAEAMLVENVVPAKCETETIILHTPTEEGKLFEKVASTDNSQDACYHKEKKMSNEEIFRSEEVYPGEPEKIEQGAATTNVSSFWINLKSIAVGIINQWKK